MPRVPTQTNFQASINTSRGPAFDAPSGPQGGQIAADQVQQMGAAVGRVGDVAAKVALDVQQETNRTRWLGAVRLAKEISYDLEAGPQGFRGLKGYEALHRPGGKSLVDEYEGKFNEALGKLEQDLGNDAQKAMFRETAGSMRAQMRGLLNEHTLSEFRGHKVSELDGTSETAKRGIPLHYNRTEPGGMIDQYIQTIEASVREKARLLGQSQELADNVARREISGAHRLALRTALEKNDVTFADGYLKKYRDSMEPDDILAVQGTITKEMDQRQAFAAASTAVTLVAPRLAPTDWDRVVNITIQTESAGNPNAVSPKGAKGLMQVMPATAKSPGFGIKPSNGTPEDDVRLGKEYLSAMLKRYEGDMSKAWAAYNAGPGALDDAMKRAGASRTPGADWLTLMPGETQAYVTKNMKALQGGQGAQPATLADVQAQVRRVLGPDAKPHVIKAAEDEAERRWNDQVKAKREQDDGLVDEVQRALLANGGDFGALSANLRAAIPAGKVPELMSFADKLRKGQEPETDWGLYYKLASDPALLKVTNLGALRSKLAPTEFKQLTEDQARANKGGESLTQLQSANDVLNGFMEQAGINPNPKFNDKQGAEKVGRIKAQFQARISAREQATGKKLGTNELREEAAALFQPVKVPGLIFDSERAAVELSGADAVVVPDAERAQIVAALKRAGRPATEQAIESLYRARLRIPQRTAAN
jgi:Transglycosylase SLT domain